MSTQPSLNLLFSAQLNYLGGIPSNHKVVTKLKFTVTSTEIIICDTRLRKRFPTLHIPYYQIKSITFKKGIGTFWYNSPIAANFNESLIQFHYVDSAGQPLFLLFELMCSKVSPMKTYRQCQVLKNIFLTISSLSGKITSE